MSMRLVRAADLQPGVGLVESQYARRRVFHTPAIAADRRNFLVEVQDFARACRRYNFTVNAAKFANGYDKRAVLKDLNRAAYALWFYELNRTPEIDAELRRVVQGVIDGTGPNLEAFPLYDKLTAPVGAPETEESGSETEESGSETEESGSETEESGSETGESGSETEESGPETEESGSETEEEGEVVDPRVLALRTKIADNANEIARLVPLAADAARNVEILYNQALAAEGTDAPMIGGRAWSLREYVGTAKYEASAVQRYSVESARRAKDAETYSAVPILEMVSEDIGDFATRAKTSYDLALAALATATKLAEGAPEVVPDVVRAELYAQADKAVEQASDSAKLVREYLGTGQTIWDDTVASLKIPHGGPASRAILAALNQLGNFVGPSAEAAQRASAARDDVTDVSEIYDVNMLRRHVENVEAEARTAKKAADDARAALEEVRRQAKAAADEQERLKTIALLAEEAPAEDERLTKLRATAGRGADTALGAANEAREAAEESQALYEAAVSAENEANLDPDQLQSGDVSRSYNTAHEQSKLASGHAIRAAELVAEASKETDIPTLEALVGSLALDAKQAEAAAQSAIAARDEATEQSDAVIKRAMVLKAATAEPESEEIMELTPEQLARLGPTVGETAWDKLQRERALAFREANQRAFDERQERERLEKERLERQEARERQEAEEARLAEESATGGGEGDEDLYILSLRESGMLALTLAAEAAVRRGAPGDGPPSEPLLAGLREDLKPRYVDPMALSVWPKDTTDDTPWRALFVSTTIMYREGKLSMPVPTNAAMLDYLIGMFLSTDKFAWIANLVFGHILPAIGPSRTRSPARLRLLRLARMAARRAAFMARFTPDKARALRMVAAVADNPPRYIEETRAWSRNWSEYRNLAPIEYPAFAQAKEAKAEGGRYGPEYENFFGYFETGGPLMLRAFGVTSLDDLKARFVENTRRQDAGAIADDIAAFVAELEKGVADDTIKALDKLIKAVVESSERGFDAPMRFLEVMMPALLMEGVQKGDRARASQWRIARFDTAQTSALVNYAFEDSNLPSIRPTDAQVEERSMIAEFAREPMVPTTMTPLVTPETTPPPSPRLGSSGSPDEPILYLSAIPPRDLPSGAAGPVYGDDSSDGGTAARQAALANSSFDADKFIEAFDNSVLTVDAGAADKRWLQGTPIFQLRTLVSLPTVLPRQFLNAALMDVFGTLMCRDNAKFHYISTEVVEELRLKMLDQPLFAHSALKGLKAGHTYLMPVNGTWTPEDQKRENNITISGDHWSLLGFQVTRPPKTTEAVIQRFHHLDPSPNETDRQKQVLLNQRLAAFHIAYDLVDRLGFSFSEDLNQNFLRTTLIGKSRRDESTQPNKDSVAVWQHRVGVQTGLTGACGRIVLGLIDHIASGRGTLGNLFSKMNVSEYGKLDGKAQTEWLGLTGQMLSDRALAGALTWFGKVYDALDDYEILSTEVESARARTRFLAALKLSMRTADLSEIAISVPKADELTRGAQTDEND